MTIDAIDFSKLKPYDGKTTRSFELLIYRLMVAQYQHLGDFTAIAGEGGDGGIEFYLKLRSGETWGWQCKFYSDKGRLSDSNRTTSIENSLAKACINYPDLTKWTLCLKTNLTVGITNKNGVRKNGERDWFIKALPLQIPIDRTVDLNFFGEDEIITSLVSPDNNGVKQFFFGDLEINQAWFEAQCSQAQYKTKDKYDSVLHTIGNFDQSYVDSALMNPAYIELIKNLFAEIPESASAIKKSIDNYYIKATYNERELQIKNLAFDFFGRFEPLKDTLMAWFDTIIQAIAEYDLNKFNKLLPVNHHNPTIVNYLNSFPVEIADDKNTLVEATNAIYRAIEDYFRNFERIIRNYLHRSENYLIFLADAAEGKTHLACDIVHKRLKAGLPAIFLTGDSFNNHNNLTSAITTILDIPVSYSLGDLLASLDSYGKINRTKIPIIIDGLNETTYGRGFSTIWRDHLASLSTKVQQYENLVLIVTCRNSYADDIWTEEDRKYFHWLGRWTNEVKELVQKYFNKYCIVADLTFANLNRFEQPIFLKIFCEIKNPNWQSGRKVRVNIDSDTNNELFGLYFKEVNKKLQRSSLLRRNESFVEQSMASLAEYFWEQNLREIPIKDFYKIIDGEVSYRAGESRADLLIDEGLVFTRDVKQGGEYVSLTYEIMAGYIIAKYLLSRYQLSELLPQGPFHLKTRQGQKPHPLYENIVDELALLFPQHFGTMLHDYYSADVDEYINYVSIRSLWFLQGEYIRDKDVDEVALHFQSFSENRVEIIQLSKIVLVEMDHPLNAAFLSNQLRMLSVKDRDLTWTENLRHSSYENIQFLEDLIRECRIPVITQEAEERLHLLILYVQWFLTSTDRKLRDTATKLIYFYGCRYSNEFTGLVYTSLTFNDPYVWERMLAALYGVVLSKMGPPDNDFRHNQLKNIGLTLYELIFKKGAKFYTTHVLARDYAVRCVEIAIGFNPSIGEIDEKQISAPFRQSKKIKYSAIKKADDTIKGPMRMDFSNYTIGTIVKDGFSYKNPPEKEKVRRQLFYRIYQLGWSANEYEHIENSIENYSSYDRNRPRIERYGKKYSWISFFELAGYRNDLGLLNDSLLDNYRSNASDIDPSFPENIETQDFIRDDFLGDRSISLIDWLQVRDTPDLKNYITIKEDSHEWVCLDGYINQEDGIADRGRFTFIRGIIVKQDDLNEFLPLFENQRLGGRWIPEILQNFYTFAGELYLYEDATHSNATEIAFELSRYKKRVKKGEEGYFPDVEVNTANGNFEVIITEPASKTIILPRTKKFNTLIPVMEYSWSSNDLINNIGHKTIVAKEIAHELNLSALPQSFDLLEPNGTAATKYKESFAEGLTKYRMCYLRKDLLDRYLELTKTCLVWGIWGEKEAKLDFTYRKSFNSIYGVDGLFEFQDIQIYTV